MYFNNLSMPPYGFIISEAGSTSEVSNISEVLVMFDQHLRHLSFTLIFTLWGSKQEQSWN